MFQIENNQGENEVSYMKKDIINAEQQISVKKSNTNLEKIEKI